MYYIWCNNEKDKHAIEMLDYDKTINTEEGEHEHCYEKDDE